MEDAPKARRLRFPSSGLSKATSHEPLWSLETSPLDGESSIQPIAEPIPGVNGAMIIRNVLTARECNRLVRWTESLGFSSGETLVEVPASIRANEVSLIIVDPTTAAQLSSRLSPFISKEGHGGAERCDPVFINRKWRTYRYNPPPAVDASSGGGAPAPEAANNTSAASAGASFFGAHYDGPQPMSGVSADDELLDVEPPKGVTRLSQMSVLLYLSDHTDEGCGGETIFYPSGDASNNSDNTSAVKVKPEIGSALIFYHGKHPLSPLHAGLPLNNEASGPKYVVRTDVLFAAHTSFGSEQWESSNYVNALRFAQAHG